MADLHAAGSRLHLSSAHRQPAERCNLSADANDYWITVDNNTVTADESGAATFNLTITPLLSFTGTVNFTLDGISEVSGLSASNPTSVINSGTTQLIVNSKTSTKVGTYPVTVIANSGNLTRTVTVNVVIPTTSVRLSTVSLNFGSVEQGTTSAGMNVTVQNTGKTALAFTSATTTLDYAIKSNTCGSSIPAGMSCIITVTFTPNAIGTINGTLTLVNGDVTSPQVVSLTGVGTSRTGRSTVARFVVVRHRVDQVREHPDACDAHQHRRRRSDLHRRQRGRHHHYRYRQGRLHPDQ